MFHAQHVYSSLRVCSQRQGLDISDAIGLFEVLDSDSTGAIEHWHAVESDRFGVVEAHVMFLSSYLGTSRYTYGIYSRSPKAQKVRP